MVYGYVAGKVVLKKMTLLVTLTTTIVLLVWQWHQTAKHKNISQKIDFE